jgi:hypothetical protein
MFSYPGGTIMLMASSKVFRPDIPSAARMYDYYLGGKDNYPADRETAEQLISIMPPGVMRSGARQNRAFLGRAVRYLAAERAIRQFLDIGTGLPTMNNVHEVAQSIAPESRVVYVDNDPVVLAHGRDMLHAVNGAVIISGDLRHPAEILADRELREMLDLRQPVAVLLVAVLHFIGDVDDPREIIRHLIDAMPDGSHLVISHTTADNHPEFAEAAAIYRDVGIAARNRTRAEVEALFTGLDLIEPGVVQLSQWHPDQGTDDRGGGLGWCGVARKQA